MEWSTEQVCFRWTVRRLVLHQSSLPKIIHFQFFCKCIQKSKGCSCVCMSYAVFVRDDVSASIQGALAEECNRNVSRPGVGSVLSVAQKSDLMPFSYLQLPICPPSLSPPLQHCKLWLFCFSLRHGFVPVRLFDWRSRGVNQCWKSERRWMETLKEGESEGEWLGLGWLVWVSLACGGAPLCWMNGWDSTGDHWHLGVKGWMKTIEKCVSSICVLKEKSQNLKHLNSV